LFGNSILQKCFQKLFSIYQFLKEVKQVQEVLFFSSQKHFYKTHFILKTKNYNSFKQALSLIKEKKIGTKLYLYY
jgi:hypothetical protein